MKIVAYLSCSAGRMHFLIKPMGVHAPRSAHNTKTNIHSFGLNVETWIWAVSVSFSKLKHVLARLKRT